MSILRVCALLWIASACALAQDNSLDLDDMVSAGQQWLEDNIDDSAWRALPALDQDQVQRLFGDLRKRFAGQYVIELAPLKKAAQTVLPLLENQDATRGYGAWLRTRLDYFEVADQFQLSIKPPTVEPGQPPPPLPQPTPEWERKAWSQQLEKRRSPKGAELFVPRLKPIFSAERLPSQLVWLAEVESSFDPAARSPAGAVGLYQLMPATARQLGLALRPDDERLPPEKNARAAARYLRYLYGRFQDWPLTLAAYNAGEGNVQKLLEQHRTRSFDRIAGQLPAETQLYVPKVDATLLRREGVALAKLPPPRSLAIDNLTR